MTQQNTTIKISDIAPGKETFTLRFELYEIFSKNDTDSTMVCRVADETGIVNAKFSGLNSILTVGDTYLIKGAKVEMADNHIQICNGPHSKLEILPESEMMQVVNKKNNLSEKEYPSTKKEPKPSKTESQRSEKKATVKKDSQKNLRQKLEKNDELIKQRPRNKDSYVEKQNPQKKVYQTKFEEKKNSGETIPYINRHSDSNNFVKKQEKRYRDDQEKIQKTKHISKRQQERNDGTKGQTGNFTEKPNTSSSHIKKQQNIRLCDIDLHKKELISLVVWISENRKEFKQDYWMGTVADQTGSVRMEFDSTTNIVGDDWFLISNVEVQTDPRHGFILFEHKKTQIKLWNGKVGSYDLKPIRW